MRLPNQRLSVCLLVLLALALTGCETLTPSTSSHAALELFKPIPNSAKAPCAMQRAVAEHNSVYDTLAKGKEAIYQAPCEQPVASKAGQPTS